MIKNLGHIAIRTKNLDESLKFYTETLGLKEAFRLLGSDGKPYIVYVYIAPGQFIELFPNGVENQETGDKIIGFQHICLEVDDVNTAFEDLKKKGAPIDTDIVVGKAKCIQFWTHDPDGNKIELMQLPPESMQAQAMARLVQQ